MQKEVGKLMVPSYQILILVAITLPLSASTINVPADFADIQAAINDPNTVAGDEIVVAPGHYLLTATIDFKGKAITLRSFSGNPNDTILDGQNNIFHVIQCVNGETSITILQGFTITGGNANGNTYPHYLGGGMLNNNSSPTVVDCIFISNSAAGGGGMDNLRGSPKIINCTFSGNEANHGGGMRNYSADSTLVNCRFIGNSVTNGGGGVYNRRASNPIITNCIFSGNTARDGGGMDNHENSDPVITNCTFNGNEATSGEGMLNNNGSPIVTNCIFRDEIINFGSSPTFSFSNIQGGLPPGSINGGGIIDADPLYVDPDGPDDHPNTYADNDYRLQSGSPCIDSGNSYALPADTADLDGDGDISEELPLDLDFYLRRVNYQLTPDSGIGGPRVVDMGAYEFQCPNTGADADGDGIPDDCDICPGFDDAADGDGDGMPDNCDICPGFDDAADGDGDGIPDNCDICPNDPDDDGDGDGVCADADLCPGFDDLLDADGDGVPDDCDICPGFNDLLDADGDGVCDGADICPGFDDGGPDSDGDSIPDACDICPGFDDGGPDGDGDSIPDVCDICPGFDDGGPDGDGDGIPDDCDNPSVHNQTQGTDHFTIQKAIDQAMNEDLIEVDSGTYLEAINFNGKAIILRSRSGDPNDTIIDGTGNFHVVQCVSGENLDTVLQGFTITGGNANGTHPNPRHFGGGMYNSGSSPTVTNCIIRDNVAGRGGGMSNFMSSPVISRCIFSGNMNIPSELVLGEGGGGMFNDNSSPTITHCVFTRNYSDNAAGGGMLNVNASNPRISYCTFSDNFAGWWGGGMDNTDGSNPQVSYCAFLANRAIFGGGGMNNLICSSPTVFHCTFSDNWSQLGRWRNGKRAG